MKNYKILATYDGTRYKGWQKQKSTHETIQGKIESILEKATGHPVDVIGSGRTDAGVHAKGQAANFYIEDTFTAEELLDYLNQYLPEELVITYRGNGFLQNMIRIMTGTLIEVGQGKKEPEDIPAILEAKNREKAGYTVPAQGLTLLEVKY